MKTLIATSVAWTALAFSAQAQLKLSNWGFNNYPSPGVVSSGGTLTLKGSFTRPIRPATLQGGTLAISGAYWIAPGITLPTLRIQNAGTDVILAWPDPSTGHRLFASDVVTPFAWTQITSAPAIVGAEKKVTLPRNSAGFYLLYKPW